MRFRRFCRSNDSALARLADRVISTLRGAGMIRFFASVLIVVTIGAATAARSQDTITVFASASMTDALDDVDVTFTTRTGIKVSLTIMQAQR